jgi:hypothetical protein
MNRIPIAVSPVNAAPRGMNAKRFFKAVRRSMGDLFTVLNQGVNITDKFYYAIVFKFMTIVIV